MSSAAIATCENHLQREAIGVCVRCRRRVCAECSTKVDGINYCNACLSGLAQQQARERAAGSETAGRSVYPMALLYLVLLSLAMWGLLVVVLPGS